MSGYHFATHRSLINTNRLSEITQHRVSDTPLKSRHSFVILGFYCYALLNDSTIKGYSDRGGMLHDKAFKQQIPNKEIRKLVTLGVLSATEV